MFATRHERSEGSVGYSVWLGAKTEPPLQFIKPFLDEDWEYRSV